MTAWVQPGIGYLSNLLFSGMQSFTCTVPHVLRFRTDLKRTVYIIVSSFGLIFRHQDQFVQDWGERTWPDEKLDSRTRQLLSLHTSHKRRLYLALTSSQVDSAKPPRTFEAAILGLCGRHSVSQLQQFCSGAVEFGRRSLLPPSLLHG